MTTPFLNLKTGSLPTGTLPTGMLEEDEPVCAQMTSGVKTFHHINDCGREALWKIVPQHQAQIRTALGREMTVGDTMAHFSMIGAPLSPDMAWESDSIWFNNKDDEGYVQVVLRGPQPDRTTPGTILAEWLFAPHLLFRLVYEQIALELHELDDKDTVKGVSELRKLDASTDMHKLDTSTESALLLVTWARYTQCYTEVVECCIHAAQGLDSRLSSQFLRNFDIREYPALLARMHKESNYPNRPEFVAPDLWDKIQAKKNWRMSAE